MQMQTGPAPGQPMRAWLAWTGAGELTTIVVLSVLVWTLIRGQADSWPFTLLGLLLVNLVLLEGALYWLVKHQRDRWHRTARPRPGLIRALYAANVLALASFPTAALVAAIVAPWTVRTADMLGGLALFVFACGEFVHYFLFKINMRPREWRAARARGRPVRARFCRELHRADAAARRSA